jgi:uncharacterized protein (TIGR02001 family)
MTASIGAPARRLLLSLAAGALIAAPARAADWSAEFALVSDYRYRGVSLSNGRPALQASIAAEHASGAYAEIWASSLTANGPSRAEVDATVGYAFDLGDGLSADVSATYYAYPSDPQANAFEVTGLIEAAKGPFTASLGLSTAPPQRGTRDDFGEKRANTYVFAGVACSLGDLPVTLRTSLGHERGPWDTAAEGGKWDWAAGAEADLEPVRIAVDFIGSNAGDHTLVGTLTLAF